MTKTVGVVYWILVSLLLILLFGNSAGSYKYAFYFVSLYIPVIIATTWIINSLLIPGYLFKRRFFKFFLYLFYTIIVSVNLVFILVFLAFMLLSYYRIEDINSLITDFRLMPLVLYLIVLFTCIISLVQQYFEVVDKPGSRDDSKGNTIIVRSERKDRRIKQDDIIYVESMADYVRIFLEGGERVITRATISTLHNKLGDNFLRVHRSYIVNADKVKSFSRETVLAGKKELPVSRTYKEQAAKFLGRYKITAAGKS